MIKKALLFLSANCLICMELPRTHPHQAPAADHHTIGTLHPAHPAQRNSNSHHVHTPSFHSTHQLHQEQDTQEDLMEKGIVRSASNPVVAGPHALSSIQKSKSETLQEIKDFLENPENKQDVLQAFIAAMTEFTNDLQSQTSTLQSQTDTLQTEKNKTETQRTVWTIVGTVSGAATAALVTALMSHYLG